MSIYSSQRCHRHAEAIGLGHCHNSRQAGGRSLKLKSFFSSRRCTTWCSGVFVVGHHAWASGIRVSRPLHGLYRHRRKVPIARASNDGNNVAMPFSSDSIADMDGRKIFILEDMTMEQLNDFHMRLCENDVEYHDLKSMCKLNGLGGKDMKYNLRAKLIRKVREMLGKPVWDRRSYGRRVKLPSAMTDADLAKFYNQREVVMPDDKEDAIGLAFAMLVVDGAISQDVVPTTSAYDKLNTKRLIQICQKRNLPTKGNKAELLARLVDYDAQRERKVLADKAADAARRELDQATIDVPPRPPNRAMAADLREAQNTMASVSEMDLPYLRAALLARNLPIYGTSEVLIERLTNVLRKDVIEAHAGLGRMIKYAEAAVSKLNDEEVYEALAARGLASFSVGEDSSSRLANALVEEWIHAAMMPNTVDWDSEDDQQRISPDIDETGAVDDGSVDPTTSVTLLCDGLTQCEREKSIRAAREILPGLQSDQIWGTLMPFTSSIIQDNVDEVFNSSADWSEPPTDSVDIMYLTPSVNGVIATISAPLPPLGCVFRVYATPSDDANAISIISNGISQDIVLKGLSPGTAYEFSVSIANKFGEGPRSDPYHAATLLRQGVSVSVLYPVITKNGHKQFTELSWEELYGWDAGALDSLLPQQKSRSIISSDELLEMDSAILPLGHTEVCDGGMKSVSALSVFNPEYQDKARSRSSMLDKVTSVGFRTLPVFSLGEQTAPFSKEELEKWAQNYNIDPLIGRFKLKLSDNEGPIFSIVCRGLELVNEIIDSIKHGSQDPADVNIEVEHILKNAVSLEVSVIGTEKGPVALVPTEIDYFDINDYIEISDIEVTRLAYQNGGYDIDMLDRIVKLKREDVFIPASYDSKDKDLSQTRNIRHLTPPVSVSVELMNHARLAAVKLFTELGLRDYAKISFTVAPEIDVNEVRQDKLALIAFDSGAKKVWEADKDYCSVKVESLSSLSQKEETDRKNRNMAEESLIKRHGDASLQSKEGLTSDYGEIFGIPIDGRTRLDIQGVQDPVNVNPIKKVPPSSTFEGLNDPSALEVSSISSISERGVSQTFYVANVDIVPDFESKVGIFAQQLVASGLSWNWLSKHLISLAATRHGKPSLVAASVPIEEIKDGDEDWVGVTDTEEGQEPQQPSMEDIADAIEKWESGNIIPQESEGNEDIVKDFSVQGTSNEEEIELALEQSVATLNESDDLESSLDDEGSADVSKVLAQQFPGLHPCRQRVWILCGGEGYQRDESLNAAAAAMRALQGAPDLLLETFMLDPPNAGHSNDSRLKSLVSLREDILKSGASDAFLFSEIPYLHPAQIKSPSTSPPQDLNRRGVWRLAGSNIVRETVDDMRYSIDRITKNHKLSVVSRTVGDDLHKMEQILDATQASLRKADASVDFIHAPWGGSLRSSSSETSIPKYLSLYDWAVSASEKCAVVLMLLPGHPSAFGPIQELMDEVGVPYTGPSKVAADLCHERPELLRSLTDAVNYDGSIISAPPAHSISALELRATCQSEDTANEFFSRLFGGWDNKMMTIRPSTDCGIGILRMTSGSDLMVYNQAVQTWAETISASECDGATEDISMPLPPPTQFVIEPFLAAEPIKLLPNSHQTQDFIEDQLYGDLLWSTSDNWLEVNGSLLGGSGAMRCLGLSTTIARIDDEGSVTSLFDVTPPPVSILSEETAADTMLRLQLVSDRLGLSGAAQIRLLVNAATGEIVINEVNVLPDLSPDSLIMRQAALLSPPMSHVEILRELLKEAMSRGEQGADSDGAESTPMYPVDEFSASMGGILDAPDAPNPSQNYFGDPYLKVEDGYQYGFEGIVDFDEEESDEDNYDFEESSDEY